MLEIIYKSLKLPNDYCQLQTAHTHTQRAKYNKFVHFMFEIDCALVFILACGQKRKSFQFSRIGLNGETEQDSYTKWVWLSYAWDEQTYKKREVAIILLERKGFSPKFPLSLYSILYFGQWPESSLMRKIHLLGFMLNLGAFPSPFLPFFFLLLYVYADCGSTRLLPTSNMYFSGRSVARLLNVAFSLL